MKKIFVIIACTLLCVSCEEEKEIKHIHYERNGVAIDRDVEIPNSGIGYYIEEVTYNGNTHEVLVNTGHNRIGIMHWPDCKFCKSKNIE